MYESLAGAPIPGDLYRACLARFTEHDEASRARMVLKDGAADFLESARASGIPLAIVTGTPQEAIDRTVDLFDLRRFFVRVCGVPGTKVEHLGALIGGFGLDPARCLFVGDAALDQDSATAAGVPFAGVNNGDNPFRSANLVAEAPSLRGLLPLIA
jgi:phosphoglycolate phosphatase-like HAD superfamily hydrolase